jgi:hypothetical protein
MANKGTILIPKMKMKYKEEGDKMRINTAKSFYRSISRGDECMGESTNGSMIYKSKYIAGRKTNTTIHMRI